MSDEQGGSNLVASLAAVTKERDKDETLYFWIKYNIAQLDEGDGDDEKSPPAPAFECRTIDRKTAKKIRRAAIDPNDPYEWDKSGARQDKIDDEKFMRATLKETITKIRDLRIRHLPSMVSPQAIEQINAPPDGEVENNPGNIEWVAAFASLSFMMWFADAIQAETRALVKLKETDRKNLSASPAQSPS